MTHALVDCRSQALMDDLETESTGTFEMCIEDAVNGILDGGGGCLTVHRDLPVEHTVMNCPCRPLVYEGGTLCDPVDILNEIQQADG